ncbi:MAG TPA: hypothetical protein VGS03_20655 [Candidatus Polarisedimenticolia bacterium]|jgi:hypothetical protein|nr:hypothetical protein [Candidatus Polarisedimenticolia bacterium]
MSPLRPAAGIAVVAAILLSCPTPARALPAGVSYLYRLSSFAGTVPYSDARLHADEAHGEILAIAGNTVRVFNGAGMEIYRFDSDPSSGQMVDVAVVQGSDLVLLVYPQAPAVGTPTWSLVRVDFRGVPQGRITLTGLPAGTGDMRPDSLFFRDGRLLLVDRAQWRAVALDLDGAVQKSWDLQALAGLPEKERGRNDMGGANLDAKGALLFTVPTIAKAFVLPLDGKPRVFGRGGSAPGSFGIPAGIAADGQGRLFVADKARGVVMLFNPQLEFVTEFGTDDGPSGLSRPSDLLYFDGKLYVTQSRDRGVSVFRVAAGGV